MYSEIIILGFTCPAFLYAGLTSGILPHILHQRSPSASWVWIFWTRCLPNVTRWRWWFRATLVGAVEGDRGRWGVERRGWVVYVSWPDLPFVRIYIAMIQIDLTCNLNDSHASWICYISSIIWFDPFCGARACKRFDLKCRSTNYPCFGLERWRTTVCLQ